MTPDDCSKLARSVLETFAAVVRMLGVHVVVIVGYVDQRGGLAYSVQGAHPPREPDAAGMARTLLGVAYERLGEDGEETAPPGVVQ